MMQQFVSQKGNGSKKNTRLFYFDLLRSFACLCVIMIHACSLHVSEAVGSTDFWFGNLFNSISRPAVPLFVMLSGALMLDENYAFTKEKWIRHIVKMLSFFVFWSLAYCFVFQIVSPIIKHREIDLANVVWSILKGHSHLWFVPMIIGLYLLVPLLRLWVKGINRSYVEYFLLLSAVFAFVLPQAIKLMVTVNPKLEPLYEILGNVYMEYPLGFTSYFILGWYLHNYELPRKKLCYLFGVMGVGITFAGTYGMRVLTGTSEYVFHDVFSVNVLFYSIAIFVFAKSVFGCKQSSSSLFYKGIQLISKYSLGIYAVHSAVVAVAYGILSPLHASIAIPAIFIVSAVVSVLASVVISKLPFIRKFI